MFCGGGVDIWSTCGQCTPSVGMFVHVVVSCPKFVRKFGRCLPVLTCGTVNHNSLDGVLVNTVHGAIVPRFLLLDILMESLVVLAVEEVNIEFAAVGGIVDR